MRYFSRRSTLCWLLSIASMLAVACASGERSAARAEPVHTVPGHTASAQAPIHLVVLHTNDVHGQLLPRPATGSDAHSAPAIGGLPRLAAAIARETAAANAEGASVIAVDAGDWYQGTPEGALDDGLPFVEALSSLPYDAMSLGNHEFDHGVPNLRRLLGRAHSPIVCANLREPSDHSHVAWIEPWRVVERAGLRIALVGLITPSTPEITHRDARALEFESPSTAIDEAERALGSACDLLIPVGHLGVDESTQLALAHPELPLIVSGHSHTALKNGVRIGATTIVQTGAKAAALGRVDLVFDPASRRVTALQARLIELADEPDASFVDRELARRCDAMVAAAQTDLDRVVGELAAPLERAKGFGSSSAGNWTADLLRERTGADVGVHNQGGMRSDLRAGPVTRRELFELAPFDNTVVSVELRGADLESLVRRAIQGAARTGSTGRAPHTGLEFSGLVAYARRPAAGKYVYERCEVGGRPIDPDARYRVATNSFLADGGDGCIEFTRATSRREEPLLVRELYEWGFARQSRVTPPTDARCIVLP